MMVQQEQESSDFHDLDVQAPLCHHHHLNAQSLEHEHQYSRNQLKYSLY